MLIEVSQKEKDENHMTSLLRGILKTKQSKTRELVDRRDWWFPEVEDRG